MREKNSFHFFRLLFFTIILMIILIIIYGKYLGNKGLILNEYNIYSSNISDSLNNTRIAHFGDILYNDKKDIDFFDSLIWKMNSKNVDIVIFTGDLVDKNYKLKEKEINLITEKLKSINSKYGKYYVTGKNDKNNKSYDIIMKNSDFISLDDSYDTIFNTSNDKFLLYGLTSKSKLDTFNGIIEKNKDIYKIAVFHESDYIENIKNANIDLAISSNSLSNQINIPLIKKIFEDNDSRIYKNNYYKINNIDFYITNGIGTKSIDFRLFSKPSYNIYILNKK